MRDASAADVPAILAILQRMHAESRAGQFDLDLGKLRSFVSFLINHPEGIVLVDGKPLCGVVMGIVQEMWFGRDKEAFNMPLYVLPEHRGGPYGVRLVNGYKRRALELGAHPAAVTWCNNSGIEIAKTNRFIGRLGFSPIGDYFVAT